MGLNKHRRCGNFFSDSSYSTDQRVLLQKILFFVSSMHQEGNSAPHASGPKILEAKSEIGMYEHVFY